MLYSSTKFSAGRATLIATKHGLLLTLSNDIDKIIMLSGGRGGCAR